MIKDILMKAFGRPGGLSCKQAQANLQSYLDGEIDDSTADDMAAHLDACRKCMDESELYQSIQKSIKSRAEPLDPEIVERLTDYARNISRTSGQ